MLVEYFEECYGPVKAENYRSICKECESIIKKNTLFSARIEIETMLTNKGYSFNDILLFQMGLSKLAYKRYNTTVTYSYWRISNFNL